MQRLPRDLILFGTGSFAEVARAYFEHEGGRRVAAYTVHGDRVEATTKDGLPIVAFETLRDAFPPETHDLFVAVGYSQVNRLRARICHQAKELGYTLATFVSPRAHVWPGTPIGENSFIFEDNTIQPFVSIGDNVVLWSGNHIGHHSTIGDHCFLASHIVVSGHCQVGPYTFIGVNATLRDNLRIGASNVIGAGALVMKSTEDNAVHVAKRTPTDPRTSEVLGL